MTAKRYKVRGLEPVSLSVKKSWLGLCQMGWRILICSLRMLRTVIIGDWKAS